MPQIENRQHSVEAAASRRCVTLPAVLQRINRALAEDCERLRKYRGGRSWATLGDCPKSVRHFKTRRSRNSPSLLNAGLAPLKSTKIANRPAHIFGSCTTSAASVTGCISKILAPIDQLRHLHVFFCAEYRD